MTSNLKRMQCWRSVVCDGEYEVVATVVAELWQDQGDMEFGLLNPRVEVNTTSPAELTRCNKCGHQLPGVFNAQTKRGLDGMGVTGKWTVVTDWYGDTGREPVVIHAVGDTPEAARTDASLKAFKEHNMFLNVLEKEIHPEVSEIDDEGYIVAMFRGHHEEARF